MNKPLIGLLIIMLVGLAWFWQGEQSENTADDTPIVERNQPDLFGEDVQFNQLNEQGELHYRLIATTIRQFTQDNLTRMESPQLHLRSATQPPWDVNAKEGFIRETQSPTDTVEDVVFLRNRVRMRQENPNSGVITLRSDSIYLYPDRQFAETQQDVIIDTEYGRTTAASLQANLDTGVINLSSSATQRVHTIVLPEQFKKN